MKKSSLEMAVGVFVIIGLLCVGYLTIKLGQMELLGDNYYTLYAKFNSATGLKPGSNVEIAGVRVGQVEDVILEPVMKIAKVTLKIEKGIELDDDSIASVKTSGLIGDKFILITSGGSGDILEPGGTITETESALDIEDLVSKYVFGDKKNK
ncbi:MAG: outer membrane lipid asymmetry maintenance protein MlaD [Proteobacteria bacterium]|nr:outer membrane lipid asymmetry maintenance protein MlaD [Pseudomonadota bacterium]